MLRFRHRTYLLQKKRLSIQVRAFGRNPDVGRVNALFPRFYVIPPIDLENAFHPIPQRWILHRPTGLDSPKEIARRPVRATQINLVPASIFESVNPAVFQESADDAPYGAVFADSRYTRTQATNTPDQKSNLDTRLGSGVQGLDDVLVDYGVDLHVNTGRFAF